MGTKVIPYEPYHPHLGYTLAVTLLAWLLIWIYGRLALANRPRTRVALHGLAIALPLYAELCSYLIFRVRPGPETTVGNWLSRFHAFVLNSLPLDTILSATMLSFAGATLLLLLSIALLRHYLGITRLNRFLAGATPLDLAEYPDLAACVQSYAISANCGLPSIMLVESRAPLALTAGVLRARIYLSRSLLELLTPDELLAVICHEWAHILRRDNLWNSLLRLLRDSLWFLPGNFLVWRAMLASQDEACDALAAAMTEQPLVLARALVKVARAWHGQPAPDLHGASPFALALSSPRTRIEQMIRLGEPTRPPRRRTLLGAYLLAGSLLVLAVLPAMLGS